MSIGSCFVQGDCQTAVSMLIVLNSEVKDLIDESVQEQWFVAYIGEASSS